MSWYMIWPDKRVVSDEQVIRWATDLIADGRGGDLTEADVVQDARLAVSLLQDEGVVTFGHPRTT